MVNDGKLRTHTAYAFSRQGRKFGRLLECGTARVDKERDIVHVFLDRAPVTGYTGYVVLSPLGAPPPIPEPQRPGDHEDEESEG